MASHAKIAVQLVAILAATVQLVAILAVPVQLVAILLAPVQLVAILAAAMGYEQMARITAYLVNSIRIILLRKLTPEHWRRGVTVIESPRRAYLIISGFSEELLFTKHPLLQNSHGIHRQTRDTGNTAISSAITAGYNDQSVNEITNRRPISEQDHNPETSQRMISQT